MTMDSIPLDVVPGTEGICSTCENPQHGPASKADHPFTVRVKAAGYALRMHPDTCPVDKDQIVIHDYLDLDLDGKIKGCDRAEEWAWR